MATSVARQRTSIVWGSFLCAMTVVVGLLSASDREVRQTGFVATNLGMLAEQATTDPVFNTSVPLDRTRWTGIVIHDLGAPAGDPDSIHRRHQSYGYQGLGYHFLIGNGNGLGDGVIHAGYRWNEQLPGVHTAGEYSNYHNHHSIGICLIGNGDRRPFTDRQMRSLVDLIKRLQRELDIPAANIHLHRDVATDVDPAISSPGRYFAKSRLLEQLR